MICGKRTTKIDPEEIYNHTKTNTIYYTKQLVQHISHYHYIYVGTGLLVQIRTRCWLVSSTVP